MLFIKRTYLLSLLSPSTVMRKHSGNTPLGEEWKRRADPEVRESPGLLVAMPAMRTEVWEWPGLRSCRCLASSRDKVEERGRPGPPGWAGGEAALRPTPRAQPRALTRESGTEQPR